jgi:hypothetical protein
VLHIHDDRLQVHRSAFLPRSCVVSPADNAFALVAADVGCAVGALPHIWVIKTSALRTSEEMEELLGNQQDPLALGVCTIAADHLRGRNRWVADRTLRSSLKVLCTRVVTYAHSSLSPPSLAFDEGTNNNLPGDGVCYVVLIPLKQPGILVEVWDSANGGVGNLLLVPYGNFLMVRGPAVFASDFMISPDGSQALVMYVAINCSEAAIQDPPKHDELISADPTKFLHCNELSCLFTN